MDEKALAMIRGVLFVAIAVIISAVILSLCSCGTGQTEPETISVYCTSPEPGGTTSIDSAGNVTFTPSTLDRIIVVALDTPITQDNWTQAVTVGVQNEPAPPGQQTTIEISYEVGKWLAAVAYNVTKPNLPSPVSNTIQISIPNGITDLRF